MDSVPMLKEVTVGYSSDTGDIVLRGLVPLIRSIVFWRGTKLMVKGSEIIKEHWRGRY